MLEEIVVKGQVQKFVLNFKLIFRTIHLLLSKRK